MDFWLWAERLAWLSILLINFKRLCDYFAPYFLSWVLSLVLKNQIQSNESPSDLDNDDFDLGNLSRAFQAGMQEFNKPRGPKKKNDFKIDPNRRNVRARNNKV